MTNPTQIVSSDFSTYDNNTFSKISGIASNSSGDIIYTSVNTSNAAIVKGTFDSLSGTITSQSLGSELPVTSVSCSYNGQIVYVVIEGNALFTSTNGLADIGPIKPPFQSGNALPNPTTGTNPDAGNMDSICQVACDLTGTKLIMTIRYGAVIYRSEDSGLTWTFLKQIDNFNTDNSPAKRPTYIASNSDGTILYAATNEQSATTRIIRSTDSGANWSYINMNGVTGPFNSLGTNATGDFVFAVTDSNVYIFYPTHSNDQLILTLSSFNKLGPISVYNDGSGFIIAQDNNSALPEGGEVAIYTVVNTYSPGASCFKEGSKILCFKDGREVYLKIENIRVGDLVKTLRNGYIPINMIGKTNIYNTASSVRNKEQLYKCSTKEYPELFEDLVITGSHALLVDNFANDLQKQKVIQINGATFVTDKKYRLPVCADFRSSVYEIVGDFNIYHLALDNDDYFCNYGIWANGLLVESCSKRYLKELSNMTLIV